MSGSSPNRYAMPAPPPRHNGSTASPLSPHRALVPGTATPLTTMAAQKTSPSDVMFGQPPGAHATLQQLGTLSSDSSPSSSSAAASISSRQDSHRNSRGSNFRLATGFSPITTEAPNSEKSIHSPSLKSLSSQKQAAVQSSTSSSTASSSSADTREKIALSHHSTQAPALATDVPSTMAADSQENAKVLPYLVDNADPEDIVALVADMLNRLMIHNDTLPLHPSALTRFHSRATPAITIHSYLRRIARYTSLDKACTLILLVYIDRVCERMKGFTICSLTVHRFVCAAVVCASKALCDAFSTNGHYARVGGISLVELNMLEKEFLQIIDWRLTCSGALLQHYYTSLVTSHPAYTIAPLPSPPSSPPLSSSAASDEEMEEEDQRKEVRFGADAPGMPTDSNNGNTGKVISPVSAVPSAGKGCASGNRGRERETVDEDDDEGHDMIEGKKKRSEGGSRRGQEQEPDPSRDVERLAQRSL